MATWGLGIEHEFVLKFEKKKLIQNKKYNLFINSQLLKQIFNNNEINFYQKNKLYILNDTNYKDYINKMDT